MTVKQRALTSLGVSKRSRRTTALAACGATCAALSALLISQSSVSPARASTVTALPPPVTTTLPPSGGSGASAIQEFQETVQTLGQSQFPNTFTGTTLSSSGELLVFALPGSTALESAITALDTAGLPWTVESVPRSYNELQALNSQLGASYQTLLNDGVLLQSSGPDPATGTVDITLQPPSATALQQISSLPGNTPASAGTYAAVVASVVQKVVGTGFSISPTFEHPLISAGTLNDSPPFRAGDAITGGNYGGACTLGFAVKGNNSGNPFLLTAGHCGSGAWYTYPSGSYKVGSVSTNYLNDAYEDDFSTIAPSYGTPNTGVWGSGSNVYDIVGPWTPVVGQAIATDGSVTGEVRNNTVTHINYTEYDIYNSLNNTYYNASYLTIVTASGSNTTNCQGGDSGGPAFQHQSSDFYDVQAVGTIVAYYLTTPETCAMEQIGAETAHSNTTLIDG